MSHFRKIGSQDKTGYDSDRALQVLPVQKRTNFYLISGAGLDVSVDDESLVALRTGANDDISAHRAAELGEWEKDQVIRKVTLTAGSSPGETSLRAKLNGGDFAAPITVQVVADQNWRRVGKATGECDNALRAEIQNLPIRDAVMRVAEDQMHSAVCFSSGFGVYDIDEQYDWCGAFAYWCWKQAAFIKQMDNPFGPKNTVLWSPQRAISWAMDEATPGQVLRYQGCDPMKGGNPKTGKGLQTYREIGYNDCTLERGDIALLRKDKENGWKHVCLVDEVVGDELHSMDGNQGKGQSIKRVNRSMRAKTPDGHYCLVFIHLML